MKTRISTFLVLALVGLQLPGFASQAIVIRVAAIRTKIEPQAMNPPYLSQMPTVERVKAEIKGTDPKDTAVRQIAALKTLSAIISDMAYGRAVASDSRLQTTPDENRISRNYGEAYTRIMQQGGADLMWPSDRYHNDPKFRDEVLAKFFSPEFRTAYYRAIAWKQPANQPKSKRPSAADNRTRVPASGQTNETNPQANVQYKSGKAYLAAKNYPMAIEAFKKSIAHDPSTAAYNDLGNAYSYMKQYPAAVTAYKEAIRLKPENSQAYFNLGVVYLNMDNLAEAERIYARLQIRDKAKADELGEEILDYKIYTAANPVPKNKGGNPATGPASGAGRQPSRPCRGASPVESGPRTSSKPPQPDASEGTEAEASHYFVQGGKYREAKDYAKAIEAYKKSISLRPSIVAYSGLGIIYLEDLKQYPNALATFQQAIRLKPDDAILRYNLGITYLWMEQYEAAIGAFQEALRLDPNTATYRYNLGLTYVEMGRKEEARQVHQALQKIDQAKAYELNNEIQITFDVGDDPKELLGWGYIQSGHPDTRGFALRIFRRVILLNKDAKSVADAYREIGYIYREQQKKEKSTAAYQQAITFYQQAIRMKPDNADAYSGLGWTYVDMGQKNQALQIHRTLLRLDKKLAEELLVEINKSK